jgi:tRNA nucleotidyltransferase (CCA-adding enzyme)
MDLHRRDFTINTLALRLDGEHFGKIHDYWGGLNDLQKGHIRVLHALSFVDDATRLLRAVRFEQRFNFTIEPRTLALMEESLPLLNKLTGARLRHEINLILSEPKADRMLSRLDELGILAAIHPDLPWSQTVAGYLRELDTDHIDPEWELPLLTNHMDLRQTLGYLIWFGTLPETTLRSLASRLRFKSDIKKLLIATSKINHVLPQLLDSSPSSVVHALGSAPHLAVYAANLVNPQEKLREILWLYISRWSKIEPHTSGEDLRNMGLKPSPAYSRIITALRDAWLDGKINSPQEELILLSKLISEVE